MITSPSPPTDKMAIKFVEATSYEFVPLKELKLDWIPYFPSRQTGKYLGKRGRESQIFTLDSSETRISLNDEVEHHWQVIVIGPHNNGTPYFDRPTKYRFDVLGKCADISFSYNPDVNDPIEFSFWWEVDNTEEKAEKLIKEKRLPEHLKSIFKVAIEKQVEESKKAYDEGMAAYIEARDAWDERRNMKFY